MKLLCIKTPDYASKGNYTYIIKKGEVYTHVDTVRTIGGEYYILVERPKDQVYHSDLFIPLPGQEGLTFKERKEILTYLQL